MKAKELAERLMENPDMEIMILDGFNGGGYPRTVNFGPTTYEITKEDAKECGDCEGLVGWKVLTMGFGCY